MAPDMIQRWTEIVETGDIEALNGLLADDVVCTSPAVCTPQEFTTEIDGVHVNGIAIKALQTVMPKTAELLQG
ncbi:hypothetical protein [Mycolicibacterium thermoresistibile]